MNSVSTKYVPLCQRYEPTEASTTRKIPFLQPLVAATPNSIKAVSRSVSQASSRSEVVHIPIRLVGPTHRENSQIPRPKVIPPSPPVRKQAASLTSQVNRITDGLTQENKKPKGLRRFRSKSASVLKAPSFSCIPELDERGNQERVYFTLENPRPQTVS